MTDKENESGFDEMMTVGFYDSVTVMAGHGSTVPRENYIPQLSSHSFTRRISYHVPTLIENKG